MASAAEQMAANLSWSTFGKAKDLQSRILFAIGLLIVYRIGTYIPVPGVDAERLRQFFDQAGKASAACSTCSPAARSGGWRSSRSESCPTSRPRSSSSSSPRWCPRLQALKKEGEAGRKKINQYTRYGTVFLATFQAYGIAVGLEAENMAHDPGLVLPRRRRSSRWSAAPCS